MRLEPGEVEAIRAAAAEVLPPGSVVRLFGSRVDDARRGGDIDLHVEVPEALDARGRVRLATALVADIWMRTGEAQHIDVVVLAAGQPERRIDQAARRDGLVLHGRG